MAETLKNAIIANLQRLDALDADDLVAQRQARLKSYGKFREI
jgi:acetyl-CoA carboxylase alpha subunit